jgi:hydrogenase maturation protein HypF
MKSLRFQIRGTVQGVGFRPWVYRLAHDLELKGFVRNTSQGVCVEIEGPKTKVDDFAYLLKTRPPAHCNITQCQESDIALHGYNEFEILSSQEDNQHDALVLPDLATCPECLKDIFDKNNRRYLYPFTNCTHCGPRYSIIESLPYDRANTSMKKFVMCDKCKNEYNDPLNRRFHAQPNACPDCGPQVALWDSHGDMVASALETLPAAARLIKQGAVIAVKSLGGFHLMADALNEDAVALLRQRKARPDKPMAVMMTSLRMAVHYCHLTHWEAKMLQSAQAPIVLLEKREKGLKAASQISFNNPYLGCMLPSMPLHHILLRMVNGPVVATSGNLSEEPICIDNDEALKRLNGIADFFLVHDRPIVRHVDDSIVQIICEEPCLLRRARGFAPLPIEIGKNCDGILATGAHLKNTIALGLGTSAVISQHIGDLNNKNSCLAFEETIDSLKSIYDAPVKKVVCDSHPDYTSSLYARALDPNVKEVQHHHAHVASCMAERGIDREVLGVSWDGTGHGHDNTVWGGEFLVTDGLYCHRIAHLKLFPLPGGEQAIKEPRRSALGLLYGLCDGNWQEFKDLPTVKAFAPHELMVIKHMIKRNINIPMTSSMGRLFDGIASLTGLCHQASYEGQAAMALEFLAKDNPEARPYSYKIVPTVEHKNTWGIDWSPIINGVIQDVRSGNDTALISTRFHKTLIEIIIDVAGLTGQKHIVLTGGCFQNKWLIERVVNRLRQEGFIPYWQSQVPSNDGGIALGQIFVAARRAENVSGNTRKN